MIQLFKKLSMKKILKLSNILFVFASLINIWNSLICVFS